MINKKSYDEFRKEIKETKLKISYQEYSKIIKTGNETMRELVLEGHSIELPFTLGILRIGKYKKNDTININGVNKINKKIDFHKTKLYGKTIYFLNAHTNGYSFRWIWERDKSFQLRMPEIWTFRPSRICSRTLAKVILGGKTDYLEYKAPTKNIVKVK